MDEDDIFAIITRKMIQIQRYLSSSGKAENNPHIDIDTKAINQGATYLTSLATLMTSIKFSFKTKLLKVSIL